VLETHEIVEALALGTLLLELCESLVSLRLHLLCHAQDVFLETSSHRRQLWDRSISHSLHLMHCIRPALCQAKNGGGGWVGANECE
jgi:hypothetical protein